MSSFLKGLGKVVILSGAYGVGKTNLALNLSLSLKGLGREVSVCDLDIVNPYFRFAGFQSMLSENGIETVFSEYATGNLDIPAFGAGPSALIKKVGRQVIVDVGGDSAGAVALGQFAPAIQKAEYSFVYVYNHYRYLTGGLLEALEILKDIERVSRLSFTAVFNNSHLSEYTDMDSVLEARRGALEFCERAALPLIATAVPLGMDISGVENAYPLRVFVKKPWEE